ncbi:hypothetical protein MRX96_055834 [Rhipicephalus microplus]
MSVRKSLNEDGQKNHSRQVVFHRTTTHQQRCRAPAVALCVYRVKPTRGRCSGGFRVQQSTKCRRRGRRRSKHEGRRWPVLCVREEYDARRALAGRLSKTDEEVRGQPIWTSRSDADFAAVLRVSRQRARATASSLFELGR